jgi:hypothetical protein
VCGSQLYFAEKDCQAMRRFTDDFCGLFHACAGDYGSLEIVMSS